MSIFLGTLTDDDGETYDYGHCYQDYDDGREDTGCGMEYAYYPQHQVLKRWHDAVGLVTTMQNFTPERLAMLELEHAAHAA